MHRAVTIWTVFVATISMATASRADQRPDSHTQTSPPASRPAKSAAGQDRRRARELFDQAETEYRFRRFSQALAAYQAAYKLRRHPSILFNVAQCLRQLKQHEKALFYYKLFLADWERHKPGTKPLNEPEVKGHITRLTVEIEAAKERARLQALQRRQQSTAPRAPGPGPRPRVGRIRLDAVSVDRATVLVDGVPRGQTPLSGAIETPPGRHRVRIEAAGYQPWHRDVEVAADAEALLQVSLRPLQRKSRFWLVSTIVSLALAAGAEALAVAFTVKANEHYRDTTSFEDDRTLVVVGHATAGGLAAVSLTSLILYLRSDKAEAPPSVAVGGARVALFEF